MNTTSFSIWVCQLLVSFCACSSLAIARETTVDLPSSIRFYSSNGGTSVAAGFRSIFAAWNSTTTFERIPLPNALTDNSSSPAIGGVIVSSNGEYIFLCTNGVDGLYRFSKSSRSWNVVRPLLASHAISAMTLANNGDLVIGTGGYFGNSSGDASGIFLSTDSGDSWTQVEFNSPTTGTIPGVVSVSVDSRGTLFFVGRKTSSSSPAGVYMKPAESGWQNVYSGVASDIKCGGSNAYFLQDRTVWQVNTVDRLNVKTKPIGGSGDCFAIDKWNGDTVLVHRRASGTYIDQFSLLVDSLLLKTRTSSIVNVGTEVPTVRSSPNSTISVAVLGGGTAYFQNFVNDSTATLSFNENIPECDKNLWSRSFSFVHVRKHGWYKVDANGRASKLTLQREINLDKVNSNVQNIGAQTIVSYSGRVVVELDSTKMDTLFTAEPGTSIINLAKSDATRLFICTSRAVLSCDFVSKRVDTLQASGWPTYNDGVQDLPLDYGGVYLIAGRVYAWAMGADYPVDCYEKGGLFVYDNSTWQRSDSGINGRKTSLVSANVFAENALFASGEYRNGSLASPLRVVGMSVAQPDIVQLSSDESVLPRLSSAIVWRNGWLWSTSQSVLWHTGNDLKMTSTSEYGQISSMSWLDDKLMLVSADRGVFLIDTNVIITSVDEPTVARTCASSITLSPNPAQRHQVISLRIQGCGAIHDRFQLVAIDGRELNEWSHIVQSNIDAEIVISLDSIEVALGLNHLTVAGKSCRHSTLLIVP